MSRVRVALLAVVATLPAMLASAAPAFVVDQVRRAFSVREIRVPRNGVVSFNNADEFLHQLYIQSAAFKFSSNEQSPGQVVEIKFPASGTFEVRCEIHPKMAMTVIVE